MEEHTGERFRDALSERERQLLTLAAQGLTDNAIAQRLGISLATVGTYWGRVRIKMGPLNRTELVAHFLREEAADTLALLRSENQRLIEQLNETARTSAMLKASLEMFRGLVETAPDAIILVNGEGQIELANQQADTMFGYETGELLGLHIERVVPERFRANHLMYRMEYHANPRKRQMGEHVATMALRKNGEEFPMAAALSATVTPGGILVTCIVRDLSDRWTDIPNIITATEKR